MFDFLDFNSSEIILLGELNFSTSGPVDGLVHERGNSIPNTLEMRLSCTKPYSYDIYT